jgi:hypothetical protein
MGAWLGRLGQRKKAIVSAALVLVTLGGVSIAPLAALAALVMLFASESGGARSLAAPLIIGAAIWLVLAVLCAHACHTGSPSGPCDPDDAADA